MSYQDAIIANELAQELNSSFAYKFAFQMTCLQMDFIKTICKEKNIKFEELSNEDILIYYKEQEEQL